MDVELLIAKVYARQPVWDKWNKHHANRNVVDRLWAEVSQELNMKMMRFSKLFSLIVYFMYCSSFSLDLCMNIIEQHEVIVSR